MYSTKCDIYGIRIYNFTNYKYNIMFEKKFDTIINNETLVETRLFYNNLHENDKKSIKKIKIYTKCENKSNNDYFMVWLDVSLDFFLKNVMCKMYL